MKQKNILFKNKGEWNITSKYNYENSDDVDWDEGDDIELYYPNFNTFSSSHYITLKENDIIFLSFKKTKGLFLKVATSNFETVYDFIKPSYITFSGLDNIPGTYYLEPDRKYIIMLKLEDTTLPGYKLLKSEYQTDYIYKSYNLTPNNIIREDDEERLEKYTSKLIKEMKGNSYIFRDITESEDIKLFPSPEDAIIKKTNIHLNEGNEMIIMTKNRGNDIIIRTEEGYMKVEPYDDIFIYRLVQDEGEEDYEIIERINNLKDSKITNTRVLRFNILERIIEEE